MKSLIASLFLLLTLPSSFQINLRSPLPSTPKASSLANHNGLSPNNSPYGPPAYFSAENLRIENADGSYFALQDNGFKNASIGDGSKCDITQHAFYRICETISDCGLCAAMENCGWCQSSGRCLPGNIDGCFCKDDCPVDYYNSKLKCPSQVSNSIFSSLFSSFSFSSNSINYTFPNLLFFQTIFQTLFFSFCYSSFTLISSYYF